MGLHWWRRRLQIQRGSPRGVPGCRVGRGFDQCVATSRSQHRQRLAEVGAPDVVVGCVDRAVGVGVGGEVEGGAGRFPPHHVVGRVGRVVAIEVAVERGVIDRAAETRTALVVC